MHSDYKKELNKLVQKKKKEIPTSPSGPAILKILEILESTPRELLLLANHFNDKSSQEPVIAGKRSFRETLIHLLNIETLNYTTIYPAYLLMKPEVYPLHAERDISRLNLFLDFQLSELLLIFDMERKKTLCFFKTLTENDWTKELAEQNKERNETIYWRARGLSLHDYTHIHILQLQIERRTLP